MKIKEKLISSKESIGERFKIFRHSIGKSQNDLSIEIGVTQPTIARIEYGEHRPTFKILSYMIDTYNLNFQWLSSGRGNMCTNISLSKKLTNNLEFQKMLEDMNTDTDIIKTILEQYSQLKNE
jgi:transcriptional regulator with XRE-family HTH domain